MTSEAPAAKWRPLAAIAIVSALLVFLGLRPVGDQTILEDSIHSSGHYFFFAMVAVLVAWSIPILLPESRRRRYRFVLAFVISVTAGALLEVAQSFLPYRSASMPDMLLDIYGAASGASAAAIASHLLARRRLQKRGVDSTSRSWRARLLAPAILLMGTWLGLQSLGECIYDYWRRDRSRPTLLSATERWGRRFFWIDEGIVVGKVPAPKRWPSDGDQVLWQLILPDNIEYPGFGVYEPTPNWSGYETLAIDLESLEDVPVQLFVRIHDKHHDDHYTDRFHQQFTVNPGFQTLRLPLQELTQPMKNGRTLDLAKIEGIKWFLVRPTQAIHLRFGNLRLE